MRTTSHLLGWLEFFKKGPQQVLVRRRRIGTFIHCWWDHFPLEYSQGLKVLSTELSYSVAQSCPTLCDPMDCSPPGSSIHGISQARQRVSCHFLLQGFPDPGIELIFFAYPALGGGFFTSEPPGKTEFSYHPVIPPLGIYPRGVWTNPYKCVHEQSEQLYL